MGSSRSAVFCRSLRRRITLTPLAGSIVIVAFAQAADSPFLARRRPRPPQRSRGPTSLGPRHRTPRRRRRGSFDGQRRTPLRQRPRRDDRRPVEPPPRAAAILGGGRVRRLRMGRLVRQPTASRADRQHPTGRDQKRRDPHAADGNGEPMGRHGRKAKKHRVPTFTKRLRFIIFSARTLHASLPWTNE